VKATLSPQKWDRWRRNPCDFVEEVLHDPETGKPFQLLDVERRFMERAFETDADGRMTYLNCCTVPRGNQGRRRSAPCSC
jgi:hypothetical protein